MSRIGKLPITIPSGVDVTIDGGEIRVKGSRGELRQAIHRQVSVTKEGDVVIVSVKNPDEKNQRSLWGLFQRLISNMVAGVTTGFSRQLEINGVGFRAAVSGNTLTMQLGYSHPVVYTVPAGITVTVEKNIITVTGADKQVVGQTAAEIRMLKKPEPYKGKGIKYSDETIRRKAGKTAAKGA